MRQTFPGFDLGWEDGTPTWSGSLNTGRGRFEVTVLHRPDHGLPRVRPARRHRFQRHQGGRTVQSPHLYVNGDLCVACQTDWNPQRDDASVVVAWTAHWLASFTEWFLCRGDWPSDGVAAVDEQRP